MTLTYQEAQAAGGTLGGIKERTAELFPEGRRNLERSSSCKPASLAIDSDPTSKVLNDPRACVLR